MHKLLPCPFCGAPAYTAFIHGEQIASCAKPVLDCPGAGIFTTPERWNTRHAAKAGVGGLEERACQHEDEQESAHIEGISRQSEQQSAHSDEGAA